MSLLLGCGPGLLFGWRQIPSLLLALPKTPQILLLFFNLRTTLSFISSPRLFLGLPAINLSTSPLKHMLFFM